MNPVSHYTSQANSYEEQLKQLRKRLIVFSMLRLTIFLAMCASIYFLLGNMIAISISLVVGFALFFFFVSRFADLKSRLRYLNKMLELNQLELAVLNGDISELKTGDQYIFEEHHFNQDIDLFGHGSLFQIINRTATPNGEKYLAAWLNSNNIDGIAEKQKATEELSAKVNWRQKYSVVASLIESDIQSQDILKWVKNYKSFVPSFYNWFPILFTAISASIFIVCLTEIMPWTALIGWMFVGFIFTGIHFKRVTKLYNVTSKINDTLAQYSKLLESIENEDFQSELLVKWKNEIQTKDIKASKHLETLAQEIAHLSNRNNLIYGFISSGFMLLDMRYSFRIEKWLNEFDGAIGDWFEAIERFDAINSLGNYRFNHPNYVYPEIVSGDKLQLNAQDIGHPLLNPKSIVTNSIEVNKDDFFIITGANMAGKSTFLRTVAVNMVMANNGLPVCAKSFSYRPVKLISSMRTSDSLMNDESYFFSELKRLKFIVDAIKTDTYFIILDEILKGTNSKDKAEGSQKFVEKLVGSKSTGLIATHDLSLCKLADTLPQIRNYYFDAEIVDDELFFDYTFKKGICQNMNASFLLKKMEIV
ncbi:MAG: DNA mismatch repair protein MutS [Crocinitomicaceae bacterium]|nr:DNA mismatch repair protein MutS [Crocinitomicaceae bacterium]